MQADKKLLNSRQLAEALGLSAATVERWALEGRIPSIRPSARVVRFDLDDVMKALKGTPEGGEEKRQA